MCAPVSKGIQPDKGCCLVVKILLVLPEVGSARYNISMGTITRNVSDIPAGHLQSLEHLIGTSLPPSQQVIVQVVETESGRDDTPPQAGEDELPEWCNVYTGLSDEEIDRLEEGMPRLDLARDNR